MKVKTVAGVIDVFNARVSRSNKPDRWKVEFDIFYNGDISTIPYYTKEKSLYDLFMAKDSLSKRLSIIFDAEKQKIARTVKNIIAESEAVESYTDNG